MFKIIKNKNAFSIIEVVVAMYVVTMGLLGIMSLVIQSTKTRSVNTNTLIASMLSQEAFEIVRSKRDTNWLTDTDWRTGDAPGTDTDIIQDGEYALDFNGTIYGAVDDIDNARLYLDANEMYTHVAAGNDPTRFFRLIRILGMTASSTDVECEVKWADGGQNFKYLTETKLFVWQ